NAIPQTGSLSGTLRTADIGIWREISGIFQELVEQVLAPTGVKHELTYHRGVPPVLNDDVATALIASAAKAIDPQSIVQAPQSSGGEDFLGISNTCQAPWCDWAVGPAMAICTTCTRGTWLLMSAQLAWASSSLHL